MCNNFKKKTYNGKMREDLCIKIHENMKDDFKTVCELRGVTRAEVIRNSIEQYIDEYIQQVEE